MVCKGDNGETGKRWSEGIITTGVATDVYWSSVCVQSILILNFSFCLTQTYNLSSPLQVSDGGSLVN
jgi:hypothetical protein